MSRCFIETDAKKRHTPYNIPLLKNPYFLSDLHETSGLPKVIFLAVAEVEGEGGKLQPSKSKPKVKPKVWYFVFKYSVGIFRHRL